MKKHARWLLAVVLTVAMTMSCLPAASATGSSKKAKASTPDLSAWGLNVDLSGVPAQVRQAVTNMIAEGQEPMEKETDQLLAEVVEEASGISFEAVKGSLGLELLGSAAGTVDTSRFNLGEEEFNRVMKEVLTDYFLTDLAYSCDVEDGIVTGIRFMPASDVTSYRNMFTVSDLWSMYRTPLTAATLKASRLQNDPAVLSEDDGEGTEAEGGETDPEPANEREVTLQVKWKDNNKTANRPKSVTVRLVDTADSNNYYQYPFETVKDGEATIVVGDKDGDGNVIDYKIVEEGLNDSGKLEVENGTTYTVTTAQEGNTYTVTNTADGVSGKDYEVTFNWVRDDQYVKATDEDIAKGAYREINGVKIALTLVYDAEKKEISYGPKTIIDFKVQSVTLTPTDGSGEPVTIDAGDDSVSYTTMYAFQGNEVPDPSRLGDYASYASTIKYGTYDCDYGTFEDRKDVTASAEAIHWNQMLAFTGDFAQHFGAAGDFWTSKNTKNTPYGAFKTQIDSYPEDYIPDASMDYAMEMMTLAYMSYEKSYGSLLDQKIADCLAQLDDSMTPVQKYLVIHDWIANNAEFDMGVLVKTAAGTGQPDPAQMTAFGTLLSDAMGYDGCICLGYAATFAVLVQQAFPEIYQNADGTWKTASEVGDHDIVDLVQIRFYADLAEISVAGGDSGFGKADEMFGSVHYYNAVKVTQEDGTYAWYCIDPAYDDITTEVMDQCRVETKGNISHKYFMISPVNMLGMFKDSMDYIDCRYDGVVFKRNLLQDEDGNYYYETKHIEKYNEDHVIWYQYDTDDEIPYDDERYEATWFTGAVGEIAHDDNYWYYITGPSFSYANMMNLMNQMKAEGMDLGDLMDQMGGDDDRSDKDRLVRRPRTAADEPEETEDEDGGNTGDTGGMDLGGMSSYDDPYDEILFHFGYGSVLPEDEKQGKYYDQVVLDGTYYDMYPDLIHSMGMYDGVLYFNLGNKIYTMTGADKQGDLTAEDLTVAQLKEYNDVYAKTDGRDFTGMSFYAVSKADYEKGAKDNAFHVFNRPIAAICIEDEVSYKDQLVTDADGNPVGQVKVRDTVTPTLTVSIGTNFSESYKTDDGVKYELEAVDYNPNYSKYTDDGSDPDVNDNEEFMWCANVVDTMPMKDMLSDKNSGKTESVTVDAWCGQDGYTEQRTVGYGLSDGTGKTVNKSDLALNHHYIENEREECYICAHCNDSWHEPSEDDEDPEEFPEGATKGHYNCGEGETPTFVNIQWSEDYSECTAQFKCIERLCGAAYPEDAFTCEVTSETVTDEDGETYEEVTATYDGYVVDQQYPRGKHTWDEGEVTTEATCGEDGLITYTCKVCGETQTEVIPATGDHQEVTDEAVEATCTTAGKTEGKRCSVCGNVLVAQEEIPATGHSWNDGVVTKEPTCTVKGVKTYTCETCGETKTEEIATLAHQYGNDGKCTVCGATKPAESTGGGGGGGGGGGREYDIIVEKSTHGTVTPEWESAMKGDTVTLTVKPDKGYKLETLSVAGKGGSVVKVNEKNGVYSFDMPAYAVVVKATFVEDGPAVTNTFVDVKSDAYYYDAVMWAAQNGITGGKDDTHFAPNETCTRAQAVTFLWRAAGSPAPKSTVNPFTDVKAGAYYYDAVLWAVENGITKGTTDTTFSPNATCSRAQIVTFLWRSQKSPAAGTVNPFTDVAAGTYYNNAVLWAVKNGITGGTTATTFSPNNNCTRAQIVTFLYRNVNG